MGKNYDTRLEDTVNAICDVCGRQDAEQIQRILDGKSSAQLKTLSESILIGSKGSSSDGEVKKTRSLSRAVVLSSSVLPNATPVTLASLNGQTSLNLALALRKLFPYRARPLLGNFDGRATWDYSCSDPKQHTSAQYSYLVHGIMAGESQVANYTADAQGVATDAGEKKAYDAAQQKFGRPDMVVNTQYKIGATTKHNLKVKFFVEYLENPAVLKTIIISTSLIDQNHRATYYPFGFILDVPSANIYSAAGKDQGVANRTGDILGEFQRILDSQFVANSILSPKQVLDDTGKAQGKTGYNEVVVVGLSPEGKSVEVNGLFVKVDASKNLWVDPAQKDPYVTPEITKLVNKLSNDRGIPICAILDTAGGTAKTPVSAKKAFPKILGI